MDDSIRHIKPERPEPIILEEELERVTKKSNFRPILEKLISGEYILIDDMYPTGLMVLSELRKKLLGKHPKGDFKTYRRQRSEYHHASNRLLVPVVNNRIALRKSPEIGWLKQLYPEIDTYFLPFPKVQGLNSSWQWYRKGIQFPVLEQKIYPYYGTYFPTRFDHLILFDKWLEKYQGNKSVAIDIGTGCGVLTFQMLKHGFELVFASDINPNAVISVMENARNIGWSDHISVHRGDLFDTIDQKGELIVFNPPWLPADKDTEGLDKAIYYEPGLYDRFFESAEKYLMEEGKLVVLFSNLAQSTGAGTEHPMDEELQNYDRFEKVRVIKRKVKQGSRKTKRRDNRKQEYVELWELKKKKTGK